MDKVGILCGQDRFMIYNFSRRSINALRKRPFLSAALSLFAGHLEGNVKKEVDKDGLIIREAAAAFESSRPLCDLDLEDIFQKTKKIDQAFIDGLAVPSFTLSVQYSDIADTRIRRIWRIGRTVYALLERWPDNASFSDAVRNCYSENEFKQIVTEILHLYSLETRMLDESIRYPFHAAVRSYLESLFDAMESVTEELASNCSKKIFGEENINA